MNRTLLLTIISLALFCNFSFAQSNEDLSGGAVWESEPFMAIDPVNPRHIVVAWMGNVTLSHICIKVIASFNGGSTWSTPAVIPHQSPTFTSADVSMAFDHSGNIYTTYIDSRQSPDSGAVYITKSTDGGLTFGTPNMVISGFADGTKFPLDRPWLSISKTGGSIPDTIYVTTKPAPFVAPPNRPYFTRSYDNGVTWSTFRYIDSTGYLVGNVIQAPMAAPAVDSSGKFHCVYPTYLASQSLFPQYIMATNGPANSFSYKVAYTSTSTTAADTLAKVGHRFICDPHNNKHFAILTIANLLGDEDVYCIETTNGGTSWTSPVRVNNDAAGNGKMQDMVWANFDEYGDLIAAWRDRRNASGTGYQQPSEVWGAIKWIDSAGFSANFKISDTAAPYDSIYLAGNGNDFMNVAMAQDTMSAVWGDVRTGALNIWYERKAMRTGVITMVKSIVNEKIPYVNIYPNPGSKYITIESAGLSDITLLDMTGKTVLQRRSGNDKYVLDISHIASGDYIAVVQTQNGIASQKVEIR